MPRSSAVPVRVALQQLTREGASGARVPGPVASILPMPTVDSSDHVPPDVHRFRGCTPRTRPRLFDRKLSTPRPGFNVDHFAPEVFFELVSGPWALSLVGSTAGVTSEGARSVVPIFHGFPVFPRPVEKHGGRRVPEQGKAENLLRWSRRPVLTMQSARPAQGGGSMPAIGRTHRNACAGQVFTREHLKGCTRPPLLGRAAVSGFELDSRRFSCLTRDRKRALRGT